MSFKKLLIASAAVLLLAGCAHDSVPVTVITPQGNTLKGTTSYEEEGLQTLVRSFNVVGGNMTCSGTASRENTLPDNIPVTCSDGRKGVAAFTSGDHGVITLNDGATAQFVTGDAASAF